MIRTTLSDFLNAYKDIYRFKTLEDAVFYYQSTHDHLVLIYLYSKLYKTVLTTRTRYFAIPEDDFISYSFSDLQLAARCYQFDKQTTFKTYYITYVLRTFRAYSKSLQYHKNSMITSREPQETYEFIIDNEEDTKNPFDTIEALENLPDTLSHLERSYCEYIIKNPTIEDQEIASYLGVCPGTITYTKKKLRKKFEKYL